MLMIFTHIFWQNLPISSVSPCSYISEINVPSLNLTAVTEDAVISMICKLDTKKATGCDISQSGLLRLVLRPWVGCLLCSLTKVY